MPRNDGTGPEGAGPLTGWGEGSCTDEQTEQQAQNASVGMRWRPMRRRAYFSRWRRSRMDGRGRGGRRRRGTW